MASALDSSTLIAALASWHARHDACRRVVAKLLAGDERPIVPAHAVVETYSVLTRLPPGYRIAPSDARGLIVAALRGRARIVSAHGASTWALLEQAEATGVAGGSIYDLRILSAAREAGATRLYTLNPKDFERFGVADVEIVEPGGETLN